MTKTYFENIRDIIIGEISESQQTLEVCVAWITDPKIFNVLNLKASQGIDVRLILHQDEINENYKYNHDELISNGGRVFMGDHHNKFCIIDKQKIITGSYNWTVAANNRGIGENIVLINDESEIVDKYTSTFSGLLEDSIEYVQIDKHDDEPVIEDESTVDEIVPCFEEHNNGKKWFGYFYKDSKKILIKCVFDDACPFLGEFAKVVYRGKVRYVSKEGFLIQPVPDPDDFGFTDTKEFTEGISAASISNDYGNLAYRNLTAFFRGSVETPSSPKYEKYGFIDINKETLVVIPFIYDSTENFEYNSAIVKKDGKYGLINKEGQEIIPFIYDNISKTNQKDFHEISLNGKKGYLNRKTLTIQIPIIYDQVEYWFDGLARVKKDGKWGYIDISGQQIIPFKYDELRLFFNGLAAVKKDGKWGYIDIKGQQIIPLIYEETRNFSEGLAAVKNNGKWGYIDIKGQQIIPLKYEETYGFSEGLAAVKNNGKWGYVDKNRKVLKSFCYKEAGHFKNGQAKITKEVSLLQRLISFMKMDFIKAKERIRKGHIDKNGNEFWLKNEI